MPPQATRTPGPEMRARTSRARSRSGAPEMPPSPHAPSRAQSSDGPSARPTAASAATMPAAPQGDGVRPLAFEAHPVEDQPRLGDAEQPRPRIPRLWARRHGADLDEAEAEPLPEPEVRRVLVHPGREAERRGEADAEDVTG